MENFPFFSIIVSNFACFYGSRTFTARFSLSILSGFGFVSLKCCQDGILILPEESWKVITKAAKISSRFKALNEETVEFGVNYLKALSVLCNLLWLIYVNDSERLK